MKIELIPKAGKTRGLADITGKLNDDFKMAQCLKGAIAFYSINYSLLGNYAESVLSNQNSYICVDIHFPTDIDKLKKIHDSGCKIYLHIFLIDGYKNERHLMHTKLLYFESNENCIIWNGSHNWTNHALCGPNIESSTRVMAFKNDPYCVDVLDYLEMIKSICEPFDPRNIPLYKMLQKMSIETDDGGINIMCAHLEVDSINDLLKDDETKIIHCLSIDFHEYNIFKTVGVKIYFILHERTNGDNYLAETEITDVGVIINDNSQTYNKVIPSRYYFFRGINEAKSILVGPQVINREQLKTLSYHAELRILDCAKDYQMMQALSYKQQKDLLWEEDKESLHSLRMSWKVSNKKIKIKKKSSLTSELIKKSIELAYVTGKKVNIDYNTLVERFNAIIDERTSHDFFEMASPLRELDESYKINSFQKFHVFKKHNE